MSATKQPRLGLLGATGRAGRAICRLLATSELRARVIARDVEAAQRRLGPRFEHTECDLCGGDLDRALESVDRLIVATSRPDLEGAVFEAAARQGVAKVVKVSACGKGSEPSVEHAGAEAALAGSGISHVILRPTIFMQSFADVMLLALRAAERESVEADEVRLPGAQASLAPVDVRDLAAVAVRAAIDESAGVHRVTGPGALTVAEAVELVAHAIGRPLRYAPMDPAHAEDAWLEAGMGAEQVNVHARRWALLRAGHLAEVSDSVSRVGGIEPRTFSRFALLHDWAARASSPSMIP